MTLAAEHDTGICACGESIPITFPLGPIRMFVHTKTLLMVECENWTVRVLLSGRIQSFFYVQFIQIYKYSQYMFRQGKSKSLTAKANLKG
jgi:hypothetical protein